MLCSRGRHASRRSLSLLVLAAAAIGDGGRERARSAAA
ncbi:Hypothetical protein A7982_07932 [Minicystis rosea]|nr:Hypothetical protein A7982_07932 [Minicystis rosea]